MQTETVSHRSWWGRAVSLIGLALFLAAFWVIQRELRVHNYREILTRLSDYSTGTLLTCLALTVLNYVVLTGYDGLAIRYIGQKIQISKMMLTAFISYVFSYNVGLSVFGGSAVRYRMYSGFGFSTTDIAKIVGFNVLTLWSGFFALAGFVFLFQPLEIQSHLALPFLTVRPLGFFFLLMVTLYLAWSLLGKNKMKIGKWTIDLPSGKYTIAQVVISSLDWVLASCVLYVLMPPDLPFSFFGFLAVFLLAQLTGLVSHVPGGLGVFESVVLFFFSPSEPAPKILAALFAYRAIYYFLPLFIAMILLAGHEIMHRKDAFKKTFAFADKWVWGFVPQIFAVTIFLAGAVLLVSGATPTVEGRLYWIRDFIPLPVMELSHFLGSVAGVALLFVAWGLHRRLNAAYALTLAILSGGIVFSVLKGLDYEEATILGLMLLTLIPCRKFFYRKTALIDEPLTFGWLTAIAGVVSFSIWLGLFSYRHVEYSENLWWNFEFSGEAPRFLRAMVGVVSLSFVFAFYRLFKPPQPKRVEAPVDMDKLKAIVCASPDTSAHLALLGDKRFFFSESGNSFLMYGVQGRSWIVMGDPVGVKDEWPDLVWAFREVCDRHNGWPVFYEVGHENLYLYVDLGLTLLKLGEEARVSLAEFSLEGGSRKNLRYTLSRQEKEGFTFRIVEQADVQSVMPELKRISDVWLSEKKTREKGFSLGFFNEVYMSHFPVAVVEKNGAIVAFANIWIAARKEELSVDLMRYLPEAPTGVMEYLFLKMILWGKTEGYHWFNLGMSPLSGFQNHPLAPLWNKVGSFIYRHGEDLYNFEGLRAYKDKFDPVWEPRYLASPAGLQLPRIFTNVTALISGGIKGVLSK